MINSHYDRNRSNTHSGLVDDIDDSNQLALVTAARDSRYTSSLHESCETLKNITKLFLVNRIMEDFQVDVREKE